MADRERVVVLVRGINVGKAKQVAMSDLVAALEEVGGTGVRTYLRSGNAVMDVVPEVAGDLAALAPNAEQALLEHSRVSARVLVVTADHLRAVAAANPFKDLESSPKQLHVLFCEHQPEDVQGRLGLVHGDDEMAVGDRVVYLAYRGGRSIDSPLEKVLPKLGVTTTARNWTTVQALLALADGS